MSSNAQNTCNDNGWGMSLFVVRTKGGLDFAYTNGWEESHDTQWVVLQVANGSVVVTTFEPECSKRQKLVELALDDGERKILMKVLDDAKKERPSDSVKWAKKIWKDLFDEEKIMTSSEYHGGEVIINELLAKKLPRDA